MPETIAYNIYIVCSENPATGQACFLGNSKLLPTKGVRKRVLI